MTYLLTLILLLLTWTPNSWADKNDLRFINPISQEEFKNLSKQAGTAISYTPLAPAAPLGLLGFDIGVEVTAVNINEKADFWKNLTANGNPPDYLLLPKIHAQKGLPLGLDVGVVYSKLPQSNISLIGGEVKWALLSGSAVTPAVAIRGDYTRLLGVSDLELQTYGVDLSVSKGIAFLTPYAGIGELWINSQETSDLVSLNKENLNQTKGFVGIKAKFFILSVVAEADFATIPSYSLRTNISF